MWPVPYRRAILATGLCLMASAGALAAEVLLSAGTDDDGNPSPPAAVSHTWTLLSKPAGAADPSILPGPAPAAGLTTTAIARFAVDAAIGTYVFRCRASDGSLHTDSTVGITVMRVAAKPVLSVERGSAPVPDEASDRIDGSTAGAAMDLTYVATNPGSAALGLIGSPRIRLDALVNCTASVIDDLPGSLATAATAAFRMRITPTAMGPWSLRAAIDSTDTDRSPYDWTLLGTAGSGLLAALDIALGGPVPLGAATVEIDRGSGFVAASISGSDPNRTWSATTAAGTTDLTVRITATDGSSILRHFHLEQ